MKQLTLILALIICFASCKKQSDPPAPATNTPTSSTTTLTITVNSATITAGQSVVLTASGATTYSWSTGATTSIITVSPTSTTSYTVTGTTGSNTGTATAIVTVSTGTTPNDTVGKVKIFYSLGMNSIVITTGRDYRQDTTNVRIYHNNTQLRNHFVNIGVNGLANIENGQFTGTHAETPLWCNHGDSIVMVFDSLEINGTTSAQSDRFTRLMTKIKKDASGASGTLVSQLDSYQYGTYNYWLNPYYTATTNAWNVLGTTVNSTSNLNETWVIGGRFKLVYVIP